MIGRLLRGGFMTLVYAYLYIPIVILIVNSFNASRFGISWQGATTQWYSTLLNNDSLLQAAGHSLTMAVLSATFATLIGSLTAVALYRYRFRGKPFVGGMLFVVMMSPDIVMAISLLVLFMLLGISLGFWSLLFSHITFCLPFVVVTVYARLKGFDVKMLEAARDLGASEFTILRKIILPLAMPAVAAGWLLSFTLSMDDVVVSSFVTGPSYEILPLKIYSMVKVGVSPEVNALATILLLLSLVLVIASQWVMRDRAPKAEYSSPPGAAAPDCDPLHNRHRLSLPDHRCLFPPRRLQRRKLPPITESRQGALFFSRFQGVYSATSSSIKI